MRTLIVWLLILVASRTAIAQEVDWIVPQDSGTKASFRGIAVRNKNEAWVSGTNGTVIRTADGGTVWTQVAPEGTAELDFRDIALPSKNSVVLMSAGPGNASRVFHSADNGLTWKETLRNTKEKGFFDAITFFDATDGFLVGDPLDGFLDFYSTTNGGQTWEQKRGPALQEGEYCFAASGTNIVALSKNELRIVTGGSRSRVYASSDAGQTWTATDLPLASGNESTGTFSAAFKDELHGVVVGGDYKQPDLDNGNVAFTVDGMHWKLASPRKQIPHKACVQFVAGKTWMSVGRTGIVVSHDDGANWQAVSKRSFYTFAIAQGTRAGWMAGSDGRVARFEIPQLGNRSGAK